MEKQADIFIDDPWKLDSFSENIIYKFLLRPTKSRALPLDRGTLADESKVLVFAGGDTTANALTIGTVKILCNPGTQDKLYEELKVLWPDLNDPFPRLEDLERCALLVRGIMVSFFFLDLVHSLH